MGMTVPRSQGATTFLSDVQPMFEAVCMVFMFDLELAKMMGLRFLPSFFFGFKLQNLEAQHQKLQGLPMFTIRTGGRSPAKKWYLS